MVACKDGVLKRAFDVVVSAVALFLIWPFLVIAALAIKVTDPGPVFYRGVRAGLDGKTFRIFKFRSMVVNADKIGGPSTSADDARVTRVGAFLRRYKLDELPQLMNVFGGSMSFVGPRPEVLHEVEQYTAEERQLLSVRPGITDLSSIKFSNEGEILRGAVDPHQAYRELIRPGKIRLGLEYVRTHSLILDLRILFATLWKLFGGDPESILGGKLLVTAIGEEQVSKRASAR
jgi:lipopolysaccharide/colanic/teichoic acid biosynthesis glycosyltransferase